ncbi:MAG: aldo/keto reductase [Aigarchaeota archaeon]|nr:aldo/keto reductase [Aigarchaeota archaeon]
MEYTELGKTGVKISRIGLGAWQFSEAWGLTEYRKAKEVMGEAVNAGINFFDTAMFYGWGRSEDLLGRALREVGVKRDEVIVSTKIPGEFLNPFDIYRSVEKSVEILGLGYVDVLLAHWPPCWHHYPVSVFARGLEKLVDAGLVRYLGLSNFHPELVESFRSGLSSHDVEVFQLQYSLVERWCEFELIPYAEACRITVQAWSPLAKGALSGKYAPDNLPKFQDVRSGEPLFHPENFRKVWPLVEKLREVGERYGKRPVQVALNWLVMSSPVIVPIPGAKSREQVREIAGSVGWRMNFADWRAIDELSRSINIQHSIFYTQYKPGLTR